MPYEPTNWKSGDVVTSAKLNKIEAGIASGGVFVVTDTAGTLDKTWKEIQDVAFAVIKTVDGRTLPVLTCANEDPDYLVVYISANNGHVVLGYYVTNSENGYPSNEVGGDD